MRSSDTKRLAAGSRVPEGQPEARLAWVERAIARYRGVDPLRLRASIERIPKERREFYVAVIGQMQEARAEGWQVVLDTGCGTGESTIFRRREGQLILGMDKSIERLQRGLRRFSAEEPEDAGRESSELAAFGERFSGVYSKPVGIDILYKPGESLDANSWKKQALLLWGDVVEFWAILFDRKFRVDRMDFLYPNPWPKSQHFGRRWQGHPGLIHALSTTKTVEFRTNWKVYCEEFAHALRCFYGEQSDLMVQEFEIESSNAVTAFEAKYVESGHPIYRVTCTAPDLA